MRVGRNVVWIIIFVIFLLALYLLLNVVALLYIVIALLLFTCVNVVTKGKFRDIDSVAEYIREIEIMKGNVLDVSRVTGDFVKNIAIVHFENDGLTYTFDTNVGVIVGVDRDTLHSVRKRFEQSRLVDMLIGDKRKDKEFMESMLKQEYGIDINKKSNRN